MSGRRPPVSPDDAARALSTWAALYGAELKRPRDERADVRDLHELPDRELFALKPYSKPTETIRAMHDEARGWAKKKGEA